MGRLADREGEQPGREPSEQRQPTARPNHGQILSGPPSGSTRGVSRVVRFSGDVPGAFVLMVSSAFPVFHDSADSRQLIRILSMQEYPPGESAGYLQPDCSSARLAGSRIDNPAGHILHSGTERL